MLKTIITCQQHSICNKNCYFRAFHRCKIGTPLRPGIFDLQETHVLFLLTHLWYQIQAFATIFGKWEAKNYTNDKRYSEMDFGWQVGPKLEPESPNSGAVGCLEIVLESWSMFCRITPYECLGDEVWPTFPGLLRTLCNGAWMKWYPPILLLSTLNLKMA